MMKKTYLYKTKPIIQLYRTLVRPKLEYSIQAWKKLAKLGLTALEMRRLSFLEVFKVSNSYEDINGDIIYLTKF